jgi:hypothetical protein
MTSKTVTRSPLRVWSDGAIAQGDACLYGAMAAQQSLNRLPYRLLESRGPLLPPIDAAARWQDATTRLTYHSLVAMNRLTGALWGQFLDTLDPQPPRGD